MFSNPPEDRRTWVYKVTSVDKNQVNLKHNRCFTALDSYREQVDHIISFIEYGSNVDEAGKPKPFTVYEVTRNGFHLGDAEYNCLDENGQPAWEFNLFAIDASRGRC